MAEGEDKPKPFASPNRDRAVALSRRLTGRPGALHRQPTGAQTPAALKTSTTGANAQPNPDKEAMLAARRASVLGNSEPAPPVRKKKLKLESGRKPRPLFLVLGVLVVLGALTAAGLYIRQSLADRSPMGQVRNELLNWEFALNGTDREAAFGSLDKRAPGSVSSAIELLLNGEKADRDDSKSERSMQSLAHLFLMHYATTVKAPPPPVANDVAKKTLDGQPVPAEVWTAAQTAWRAWLVDQQNRGAVPRG